MRARKGSTRKEQEGKQGGAGKSGNRWKRKRSYGRERGTSGVTSKYFNKVKEAEHYGSLLDCHAPRAAWK